mgnify:CR=1 FL=1|jgi:hypothetical protein
MEKQFSTFSVIPTEIIINKEISSTEKLLYAVISSLTNEKGYCWASNQYLGDLIGISERHASRSINKLLQEQLIEVDIKDNSKRKITLVNIIVGRTKMSRGVDKNVVGGRQKCRTNNIIEKDKDNIYIADKSANDNLSENKPNIKIQDLYNKLGLKTPIKSVYQWQDEANNATQYFKDGESKRSSIFKCFKDNQQKARIAFSDCKELGRKEVLYFLKVYNELKK